MGKSDIKDFKKYTSLLRKIWRYHFQEISNKELLEKLDDEVFTDQDFIRQVEEVSIKTNIPHEAVESVIKHYIIYVSKLLIKIQKVRLNIKIYGFFILKTNNVYYDPKSRYYYKRAYKINKRNNLKRILKTSKKFKNVKSKR